MRLRADALAAFFARRSELSFRLCLLENSRKWEFFEHDTKGVDDLGILTAIGRRRPPKPRKTRPWWSATVKEDFALSIQQLH